MKTITKMICLLLMCSCAQQPELTEQQEKSIREDVRNTLLRYYADIKSQGLMAEFRYLDSSEDFFWVPPDYQNAISYDSVAAILRRNAPKYKTVANAFDTLKIIPLTHDMATYTGRLKSTITDTAGQTTVMRMMETGIMVKRGENWKLLHGQTSLIP